MNRVNLTVVIIFSIVVLVVFLVGVRLLGGWCYGDLGGVSPGMMGPCMMSGWGLGPLSWIGMFFMWLIPVGLVILVVLGIVWLVRAMGSSGRPTYSARACSNCGRSAQADWRTCPYCGQDLS